MWQRRVAAGVLLVTLLAAVLSSDAGHTVLLRALQAVEGLVAHHPAFAAVLVVLFTAVAAMLAFVSSWLVIPFAVYTWGPFSALLLLLGGWLLGGVMSYAIGRFLGRSVIRWLGFGPVLGRYEERITRHTPFLFAVLLQMALPSEIRGYLFGLGRYRFTSYLLSFGLAELPFGIATVYLGAGLVDGRTTLVIVVGTALVLLSASAAYALHRRLAAGPPGGTHGPGEQPPEVPVGAAPAPTPIH